MKALSIMFVTLLATAPADAATRYTATNMTCEALQRAIDRDGAAVVYYKSKNTGVPPLFERFVRNQLFCQSGEVSQTRYVPTSDMKSCPVIGCVDYDIHPDVGSR